METAKEEQVIHRVPVVQQVEQIVLQRIQSGEFSVGDKLPPEMSLCQSIGVGRGTVREAFRLLEAKGVVEIKPGRGAFVANPAGSGSDSLVEWFVHNEVELHDCVEVRSALEPMAVRLTIERGDTADLAKIQRIHQKFVRAVEQKDAAEVAKYDERFHTAIVEASHNRLLIKINHQISEWIKSFRSKTFQVEQNALNAVEPHSNILSAIEQGDAAAGEEYMRRHLQKVAEDMQMMTQKRAAHTVSTAEEILQSAGK